MNTYGIIDPFALKRIREENAEKVNFEQTQQLIIEKINKEWKSKSKIHQTISNNSMNTNKTNLNTNKKDKQNKIKKPKQNNNNEVNK